MPETFNYVSIHSGGDIDEAVSLVQTIPESNSENSGKILVVTESAYNASDFSVVFADNIGSIQLTGYQAPTGTQPSVIRTDTIPTAFKKVQGQINSLNSSINNLNSSISRIVQDYNSLKSVTSELSSDIAAINSNLATMSSTIESVGFTYQAKDDLLVLLTNMISEGGFSTTVNSNLQTLKADLGLV